MHSSRGDRWGRGPWAKVDSIRIGSVILVTDLYRHYPFAHSVGCSALWPVRPPIPRTPLLGRFRLDRLWASRSCVQLGKGPEQTIAKHPLPFRPIPVLGRTTYLAIPVWPSLVPA
jgi:hypothetical protein